MTEETYNKYLKRIKRWAWKKGICDVEDLFHDTYIKYLNQDDKESITIGWFYRVIENAHCGRHRHSTSRFYQDDFSLGKKIFYSKPTSKDWDTIRESYANVRNNLSTNLTPKQLEAIYSAYLGGMSRKEISNRLGCSTAQVGNLIHRPLKELRECMIVKKQPSSDTRDK